MTTATRRSYENDPLVATLSNTFPIPWPSTTV
jgi:hypothetical protein